MSANRERIDQMLRDRHIPLEEDSAEHHIFHAASRIHGAYRAVQANDGPLTRDKLDEAFASIVAARRALGGQDEEGETWLTSP